MTVKGEKSHHSYVLYLLLTREGELGKKFGTGRLGMNVHNEPEFSIKNLRFWTPFTRQHEYKSIS
jgi:hypothetical protein